MIIPPIRTQDTHGSGEFGASRGSRTHRGVDLCAWPGSVVLSMTPGTVTKLGYPYGDDTTWRYVEVTLDGNRFRYFYLRPMVIVGQKVEIGDQLGMVQDLRTRYQGITPHYHFEIINPHGEYVNPKEMFEDIS